MNNIAIGVVSLGCDKNRIDTEEMLGRLAGEGFGFTRSKWRNTKRTASANF